MLATNLVLSADPTAASLKAETHAKAELATQVVGLGWPTHYDQSAGSALYINEFGDLFMTGDRSYGDGNGGAPGATQDPTLVKFPLGVRIDDAVGSSNDFDVAAKTMLTPTDSGAYMALDDQGRVWTWGKPYGGPSLIGRGGIGAETSRKAGLVTTAGKKDLSGIVDIEMAENQFFALDKDGQLWAWGHSSENLPIPEVNALTAGTPALVGATTVPGDSCLPMNVRSMKWHSIWGGNNATGAVATNGLIYTWGYDSTKPDGHTRATQRCPMLNKAANKVLFQAYPWLYQTQDKQHFTEKNQSDKLFDDIVKNMAGKTLDVCEAVSGKRIVDDSDCPVRQLGFSARAPRLLLQNGDLYTWAIDKESPHGPDYGAPFLGRDLSTPNSRHHPAKVVLPKVDQKIDQVVAGIGSIQAVTTDGKVFGWGKNNYCQAIGRHPNGTGCAIEVSDEVVKTPTEVKGLGEISQLAATQCAAWAIAADGATWAWGAGTVAGRDYTSCAQPTEPKQGYKIYDQTSVTAAQPYGKPVDATATGVMRVL